jgi:hypothetical protein
LHGERRIRSHRGFGEQQEAQMRVNRPVKKMIALVLGGVAVAVAAVAGAQAAGAQPGARVVTVAAGDQGKSRAVPPMLGPLSVGAGGGQAGRGAAVAGAVLSPSVGHALLHGGDECLRGRGLCPVLTGRGRVIARWPAML